jgi:hypothetical protein
METRKRLLRNAAEKTAAKQCFNETLSALQRELREIYKDARIVSTASIEQWYEQFAPHQYLVQASNENLMLKSIPILLELQIPQHYVVGLFSDKSKIILWKYIQQLSQCACTFYENDAAKPEVTEERELLELMGDKGAFFDSAPPAVKGILKKGAQAQAQMTGAPQSLEDFQKAVPFAEIQAATAEMMRDPAQMRAFFKMFSQMGPMTESMLGGR